MSEHRALGRAHARVLLRSLPLVVALVGMTTVLAQPSSAAPVAGGPAAAGTATITVTPNTGLADAGSVTVKVTTTSATAASVFFAVTQCGNATTAGTPLTTLDSTGKDCAGAEGLAGGYLALQGLGTGAVPAGTYTFNIKLEKTNIGTNKAQCIPKTASVPLDCTIAAATATTAGSYTGPGYAFQVSAPIAYVGATTTTTTAPTTTTTAQSSTTTSTTTGSTTTTSSSTTSTTAVTSTTTTAVASSTTTGAPGITVTPNTGVTAGRSLIVHGARFTPSASVAVLECSALVTSPGLTPTQAQRYCDTDHLVITAADAAGDITTAFTARATGSSTPFTPAESGATCLPRGTSSPCLIVAANVANPAEEAQAAITLGSAPAAATSSSTPGSALAFTGSTRTNILIAFFGLALLDLGYLALSATRPGRRRRLPLLRRGG